MPTYLRLARFIADHRRLTAEQKRQFRRAVEQFVKDLEEGSGRFHHSLRVHRIDSTDDVWSLSWRPGGDGRATFQYGDPVHAAEAHVIWRRVGDHSIYRRP